MKRTINKHELEYKDSVFLDIVLKKAFLDGRFPTVREVCVMCGFLSTNGAVKFLKRCEGRGWIERSGRYYKLKLQKNEKEGCNKEFASSNPFGDEAHADKDPLVP